MTTIKQLLAISSLTLLSIATQNAYAQLPNCQSASSDPDGDTYGWENNSSCRVVAGSSNNQSGSSSSTGGGVPTCTLSSSDSDNDGWGWENNRSCRVGTSTGSSTNNNNNNSTSNNNNSTSSSRPSCVSLSSDPNRDGYGWENNTTCIVTASTMGIINDDAGSSTSNGIINDDGGSSTSNGITNPGDSGSSGGSGGSSGGSNNNGGSFSAEIGGGNVIRSSSLPVIRTNSVTTNSSGGDLFATEQVGDFTLMQNAWRAWRAAPGYDWTQTIYTNNNGIPVGWNYDWGPGVPGSSGRASDDFYVRSYPELIYGIKDEFRTSAPKSQIGFPVRVDNLPTVSIDYAFNGPQFGDSRTVNASVTNRFPNGSTIQGERNVAAESFLYPSVNGVCDNSLPVNRTNGSNHVFEVMVWLDSGAERLPAASRDFVTTITLRGAVYDVYTKTDDSRYIAFVAKNPQTSGRIYWNDYIDWARQNAHRVEQLFGANSNADQIQDSWCVANIIVGTEIFWGAGSFELSEWTITQSQ